LNADELLHAGKHTESIELCLFDDLKLTAFKTNAQSGGNGAFLWTGKIAGVEEGRVVLVVLASRVFASIYLPFSTLQVRPTEGALHLIRELELPSAPSWGHESGQATPIGSIGTGSASAAPKGTKPEGSRLIELVNLERAAEGLRLLEYDNRLASAARDHAQDMARHNYYSHDRLDGHKFWFSLFDSGYPVSKCGENIAVGLATEEEAFECLISSPSHRANIMDPDFRQIGVGHSVSATGTFHYFWVQNFGAGSLSKANSGKEKALDREKTLSVLLPDPEM
jgi:uncharacterized protein YkwD